MLIINADDFGRNRCATDRILECYRRGTVTATSFMVFMEDSERAAGLAKQTGIDTGLHLNFTEPFTQSPLASPLKEQHERIVRYLRAKRYHWLLYHPALRGAFASVFRAQWEEYARLFGARPSHIDGHHHMHLCANMLVAGLIPPGLKARRHFTYAPGQKSRWNRWVRAGVDYWLRKRHVTPDYLFSLPETLEAGRLEVSLALAKSSVVELETHPEMEADYRWLMGPTCERLFAPLPRGSYAAMPVG
jgi:chitin disaccharide deacetylase